jgi:hypothetical protein
MTQEKAVSNLHNWFWTFKHKLVDDFPEYHTTFDYIVGNSDSYGLLYEVMEFAFRYLEIEANSKGGEDNLIVTDYVQALEYGYNEWVK